MSRAQYYENLKCKRYYESLSRRVWILEQLYLEGVRDDLKKYLGDDLYNDYMRIRNRISDPEWKDFGKIQKKDLSDIRDYVDNFQSKSSTKKKDKGEGAQLLYDKDGWKVYRITTYNAAQLYGKGTKWCITGRYPGQADKGQEYFDAYIKGQNLDGGYYFYIHKDGDKYCLLRRKNGTIASIWEPGDTKVRGNQIFKRRKDFPSVPGVFEFDSSVSPEEKEVTLTKAIKKCISDLKGNLDHYYDKLSFGKPQISGDTATATFKLQLFSSDMRVSGKVSLSYKSPFAFDFSYSYTDEDNLLGEVSDIIEDVPAFEQESEEYDMLYDDFYNSLNISDSDLYSILHKKK